MLVQDHSGRSILPGATVRVLCVDSCASELPESDRARLATIIQRRRTVAEIDRFGFVWLSFDEESDRGDFCLKPAEVEVDMSATEVHEAFAMNFPLVWPEDHAWINVHDGDRPKLDLLDRMLGATLHDERAVVVVNATPGLGAELAVGEVCAFIAPYMLKAQIQIADRTFTNFVVVMDNGVASSFQV